MNTNWILILTDVVLFFASIPSVIFILKSNLEAWSKVRGGNFTFYWGVFVSYLLSYGAIIAIFFLRYYAYEVNKKNVEEIEISLDAARSDLSNRKIELERCAESYESLEQALTLLQRR